MEAQEWWRSRKPLKETLLWNVDVAQLCCSLLIWSSPHVARTSVLMIHTRLWTHVFMLAPVAESCLGLSSPCQSLRRALPATSSETFTRRLKHHFSTLADTRGLELHTTMSAPAVSRMDCSGEIRAFAGWSVCKIRNGAGPESLLRLVAVNRLTVDVQQVSLSSESSSAVIISSLPVLVQDVVLLLWRPFLFYTRTQTENSWFIRCSHWEQQSELWQFNLFSIFIHELWMNPATSKLWWLSSLGLSKSSCWCCRLCLNLQEKTRRKIRLVFKETRPVSRSLFPRWQRADWLLCLQSY